MNSAERVRAALKGEPYDRTPILEFLIDMKVAVRAAPGCRDQAECMDMLGMDGVGCGADFAVLETHEDGSYTDEWGVRYRPGPEAVSHPVGVTISNIREAEAYEPPDPDAANRLATLSDIVARYKGRRAIAFHHRAAFMWSAYLLGLDNILMGFHIDPPLVETVMDKVLEANMGVVRRAIRLGAEVIVLGDDYAHNTGPMMSPDTFERFIAPRLRKMIDMIHDEGALCIKHSDGNIYAILESIMSAKPDGLNPIEPVAGMTLSKTRELAGDCCLVGNIDCGRLLPYGSTEEVREAVRGAIHEGSAGGAFIVSSSNSIHSTCDPANVVAMVEAVKEFGDPRT